VGFEGKGIGGVIVAGMLACAASWAALIVLLVLVITSPADRLAEDVLLGWLALTVVLVATQSRTTLAKWPRTGWYGIVLAPAFPLIVAGIYAWQLSRPIRQSRADRRRRRE
jgi:chromate transport protein ChrA